MLGYESYLEDRYEGHLSLDLNYNEIICSAVGGSEDVFQAELNRKFNLLFEALKAIISGG